MDQPGCQLPPQMKSCTERFDLFFKQKNSNRTLTWLYAYGQVELQMTFTPKKYQLITNVFQAAILCLFNESTETTNSQIIQRT